MADTQKIRKINPPKQPSDVCMVIPAYNEAENIERVVDELIDKYPELDYVVVTDGPTDGTDMICERRSFNMVKLKKNMGLAECFRNGMKYAFDNGYKYAVQFDGDGQHRPEYVRSMQKKADEGYDIVMGSRFLKREWEDTIGSPDHRGFPASQVLTDLPEGTKAQGKSAMRETGDTKEITGVEAVTSIAHHSRMSLARSLGSRLIRICIKLKTGVLITDPTCGMRLYDRKIMKMFVNHKGLSPEPDTIALLIKQGAKVTEVPVKVVDRTAGNSYFDPLSALKYMCRIIVAILKLS